MIAERPGPCTCRADGHRCFRLTPWQREVLTSLADLHTSRVRELAYTVGHGRSYVNILAPLAVAGCERALLLVPPAAAGHCAALHARLAKHYAVPTLWDQRVRYFAEGRPALYVLARTAISRPDGDEHLDLIRPDLILLDEEAPDSVRSRRLSRYALGHEALHVVRWCRAGESKFPTNSAARAHEGEVWGEVLGGARTCRRCGAVSSGGAYCPRGCGRV